MVEKDNRIGKIQGRKLKIQEILAAQQDAAGKSLDIKLRLKQGRPVSAEDFLRVVSDEEG